jgi:3D (Asp-Asp-Asp) domain-containing protein
MIRWTYAAFISFLCLSALTYQFDLMLLSKHKIIDKLNQEISELENNCSLRYSNKISYKVTVTTYNPTRAQCDDTPNITADGTRIHTWKATEYRYVALSRDLISRWGGPFDYGDYIVIEGTGKWDGIYQVRDTMNPKWTNRVDILTTNSRFKYNNITMYKYVEEYEIAENS